MVRASAHGLVDKASPDRLYKALGVWILFQGPLRNTLKQGGDIVRILERFHWVQRERERENGRECVLCVCVCMCEEGCVCVRICVGEGAWVRSAWRVGRWELRTSRLQLSSASAREGWGALRAPWNRGWVVLGHSGCGRWQSDLHALAGCRTERGKLLWALRKGEHVRLPLKIRENFL